MSAWRLICDEGASAAEGLAADEALMLRYGRGEQTESPAALRLYTYRSHCALVGRYQSLEDEVDLDACRELGFDVGRRPTGGGAIVMGAGQLGVALTTRVPAQEPPREVLRRYADGVIAGLARLGIEASFRSKNDLECGGRKIAGLGLHRDDRGALLFHTSLLADLDVPLMLRVLRIPGAKLSDKAVARVSERVTTVSAQLGRPVSGAELRPALRDGFAEALGIELVDSELDSAELQRRDELVRTCYASERWLRQRSPLRDGRASALLKTREGLVRVYVGVHGDAIKSALIAGDFNVLPPGITGLEASLRWCAADRERIAALVAQSGCDEQLGVPAGTLADAIWEATGTALQREHAAHPARAEGSCYFPDDDGAASEPAPDLVEAQ